MIRWGSAVQGSSELQEFYLIATNERLNKHFFAINKHPKLQWLCATTVSPNMGTHRHQWIAPKKKEGSTSAIRKQFADLFPDMKNDELDLMAKITSKKELDTHLQQLGREK
jgi:hypothetical protein